MSDSAARSVGALLGQGSWYERLLRQATARPSRLHHAVLIDGPGGVGKSTAARLFAQALLCSQPLADGPCGVCGACQRVASGNHADLHVVAPPEDKVDIPVEAVRNVQALLGRTPVEGGARVVIIDPADRLNEQGQNALLKTLEEPGHATWLLLPTARVERMLPTVRSRSARLAILPLGREGLSRALDREKSLAPDARDWGVAVSGGSLGLALELIEADLKGLHQRLVDFLRGANDISAVGLARACLDGVSGRPEVERRTRQVLALLRTTLRGSVRRQVAEGGGGAYLATGFESWHDTCEALLQAESDLDLRMPAEQVLSGLLLCVERLTAAE